MKQIKFFLLIPGFLLLIHSGCSSESTTEPTQTTEIQAPLSKLSDIQAKIFTQNCALSGCHGTTNNQANLLLTDGNSFNNLVNVQGSLFPQFKRVVPDSSSKSLLIKILKGEVSPRMPLDRDPLPDAAIDSISAWIDKGASEN